MEAVSFLYAIASLLFVLSLIWLISYALKRFVYDKGFAVPGIKPKRLSVEEIKMLDAKRRLVIIKKDNTEHLILLGANSDLLIESREVADVPVTTKEVI